eukprot:gene5134-8740_t
MAFLSDSNFGVVGLSLTFILFFYYTVWIMVIIPFLDKDHFLCSFFPSKEFAFMFLSFTVSIVAALSFFTSGVLLIYSKKN